METFPIVKRKDVKEHGDYRTKLVILSIYDALQKAKEEGEPYQTLLDPPPADPRVAHPPRDAEPSPPIPFPTPTPYELPEPELLEVAEPSSHTTPRPPEEPSALALEAAAYEAVLDFFAQNPGWHARADVLDATGLDPAWWNKVAAELVELGEVEKKGQKRDTRYRYAGDEDV